MLFNAQPLICTILKEKVKNGGLDVEKLAIFDIDYTITRKETLMEFFKYIVLKDIKNIRFLPRALYSGLMYSIKVYDEKRVMKD